MNAGKLRSKTTLNDLYCAYQRVTEKSQDEEAQHNKK